MNLQGAVVLITGASSGIGQGAALAFDRAGARVAIAARRKERLEANAARMKDVLILPTDVTDESQVNAMIDRTVEHFGRLDILINNAGEVHLGRSDILDPTLVRHMLDVNFIGPMVAANRAVKTMRKQGGGIIINVTTPGAVMGVPYLASYCATKAAMRTWSRCVQAEWADSNITVCEYLPGIVQTELGSKIEAEMGFSHSFFQKEGQGLLGRILLRKMVSTEKVGEHLVACARNPSLASYSNPEIGVMMAIGHFSKSRYLITRKWARVFRTHLGLGMVGD